jgi:hypothetical protein
MLFSVDWKHQSAYKPGISAEASAWGGAGWGGMASRFFFSRCETTPAIIIVLHEFKR